MLTKQNHDDVKWELMNFSTQNMWRYLPESTIEKVMEVLESEITFEELQDFAFDTRGE